jgi:hypothetical protein
MGLLKNVINKAKSAYQKVDVKLGGYLPGSTTPQEVKAAKMVSSLPQTGGTTAKDTSVMPLTQSLGRTKAMPSSSGANQSPYTPNMSPFINDPSQYASMADYTRAEIQSSPTGVATVQTGAGGSSGLPGNGFNRSGQWNMSTDPSLWTKGTDEGGQYYITPDGQKMYTGAAAPITADDINMVMPGLGVGGIFKTGAKVGAKAATSVAARDATKIFARDVDELLMKAAKTKTSKEVTDAATGALVKEGVNTKTAALTNSLLKKVGLAAGSAGVVMGILGTYPFAGFIKEEAGQMINFAYDDAEKNKDEVGMEAALKLREEFLSPTIWDKVISIIPAGNVLNQVKDFVAAERVSLDIDKRNFETRNDPENPNSDAYWENIKTQNQEALDAEIAAWKKANEERDAEEEANRLKRAEEEKIDEAEERAYYERIRQQKIQDAEEERRMQEEYWAKVFAEQKARQEEQRRSEEAYWAAVKKAQEESHASHLNFGLFK